MHYISQGAWLSFTASARAARKWYGLCGWLEAGRLYVALTALLALQGAVEVMKQGGRYSNVCCMHVCMYYYYVCTHLSMHVYGSFMPPQLLSWCRLRDLA